MPSLPTKPFLTLAAVRVMAAAAEAEAAANNWNVVIAIIDDSGTLVYLQRIDGVQNASVQIAQQKAMSALRYERPTKAFEEAFAGGRLAILKLDGAMPMEGGLPIVVDGRIIGAIGVSGVTSEQDGLIAKAALAALARMIAA